jgi:hypothetical protein
VSVQPKPVRSSARTPAGGRRATAALPTPVRHRPRRHGAGEGTIETHGRFRAPLSAAPAPERHPPMRGRPLARDGVGQLLSVFLAATLVMVAAVIVVGIVARWWVLVPVMLVDFATTFGVVAYIARMLADDGESSPT